MKKQTPYLTRTLVAITALGILAVAGCELAVDFDRTKIDSGTFIPDGLIGETSTPDAPMAMDAQSDGTTPDGAMDSGVDAPVSDADASSVADADDGSDGADE